MDILWDLDIPIWLLSRCGGSVCTTKYSVFKESDVSCIILCFSCQQVLTVQVELFLELENSCFSFIKFHSMKRCQCPADDQWILLSVFAHVLPAYRIYSDLHTVINKHLKHISLSSSTSTCKSELLNSNPSILCWVTLLAPSITSIILLKVITLLCTFFICSYESCYRTDNQLHL